jgi:hypothetical protein
LASATQLKANADAVSDGCHFAGALLNNLG